MRSTRKDVAKLANVSEATVSYTFSNKRFVSPILKERVFAASKALNYYPDMIASSLSSKRTYNIGVMIADLKNPLQMTIVSGIQNAAIKKGYFVNVCGGVQDFETYIDNFISRKIDGVYVSVNKNKFSDSLIKKLLDYDIKVAVNTYRPIFDKRICGAKVDFDFGMKEIIKFLTDNGHRKIAYVSAFDENSFDVRLQSFKKHMREILGETNPIIETGVFPYASTLNSGSQLMKQLLAKNRDFSVCICTNDLMAFGAMKVLHDAGYRIPEDKSVVGIDNIEFCDSSIPTLTSLDHMAEELGETLFEVLYENITTNVSLQKTILPKLVLRESTRKI